MTCWYRQRLKQWKEDKVDNKLIRMHEGGGEAGREETTQTGEGVRVKIYYIQ